MTRYPSIHFLIRNDDWCALSDPDHERAVFEVFARYGVPMTVAVIPEVCEDPHRATETPTHALGESPRMVSLILEARSRGLLEVAQHGYTHQTNPFRPGRADVSECEKDYPGIDRNWSPEQPLAPGGFSEFAGLGAAEQEQRLRRGSEQLEASLGFRPRTFIFPWNTFDSHSLPALQRAGFRHVPGEEEECLLDDVEVVGTCKWEWRLFDGERWLDRLFLSKAPVLAHLGIHSWVYKRRPEMLTWLEDLLRELTTLADVHFLMPEQLQDAVPAFRRVLQLHREQRLLLRRLSQHLDCRLRPPPFYVLDANFYERRNRRLRPLVRALEVGGVLGQQLARPLLSPTRIERWLEAG